MEQKEKTGLNQAYKRVIYIAAAIVLLLYAGYQIYKMNCTPPVTETAVYQSLYDSVSADVFVIRDEETVSGTPGGVMVNAVTDGQRVAAGNPVVYLFANGAEAENYAKTLTIEKKLTYYKTLLSRKSLYSVDPETVDRATQNTLNKLQKLIAGGKLETAGEVKEELLDNINQRQLITGKLSEDDLNQKIDALTNEKANLSTPNYDIIAAPEPGAFINRVDGFEGLADYSKIDEFTTDDINGFLTAKPAQTQGCIGKLVKAFDWYMVCTAETLAITDLRVGHNVVVDFPFSSAEEVNAEVVRMTSEANGQSVLVLKCNLMNDSVSALRSEKARIRIKNFSGLHVSSKAVRVNDKNEKGVFVLTGNAIEFKKIKVIYTGTDFILCDTVNEKGYLELYDEVIVEGKDLYDGKIVK